MEHVVFYPAPDGTPGFRRFAALDEAVRFVEHLRNAEGVSEVSVHTLTPVPVAFRAYYKVEMPSAEMPAAPEMPSVPEQPAAPEAMTEPESDMLDEPVAEPELVAAAPDVIPEGEPVSNGRRSLGFFAH